MMKFISTSKVIDLMPDPILALMVNMLGFSYRMNRYSRCMRKTLAEWKSLESLSPDVLRTYQTKRLRHVVNAAAKTPYYRRVFRDAGFNPEMIKTIDDIQRLPIIGKADLVEYGHEMIVPGYSGRVIQKKSSGTTGQPVSYSQPHSMAYDQTFAMLYQFYGWHGFRPLERRATMAGRYMGRKTKGVVIRNWFENQLLLGVHSLSKQSVRRYLRAINAFQPQLFQAHPSALLFLQHLSQMAGLQPPDINLVSFTAESLGDTERQNLSEWLGGATIFGTYGSGENVVAAGECTAMKGYHIHPAIGICELINIDGNSEIVGTSLLNDAMPLLRYRTGDLALSISDSQCQCGCTWPRLKGVQGRVDDIIYSSSGLPIAPVVLRTGIASLGALSSPYSLIQHNEQSRYTLVIYSEAEKKISEDIDPVLAYLKSILGEDCSFDVRFMPIDAMLTSRAKHRTIIKDRT